MLVHYLTVLLVCLLQAGFSIQQGYTNEQACTLPNRYSQVAENSSVAKVVYDSPFFWSAYSTPRQVIDSKCFTFFKINETCFYNAKLITDAVGDTQSSISILCDLDGYPGTYKAVIVNSSTTEQTYFIGSNNCGGAMNYAFTVEPDCSARRPVQNDYVILSTARMLPYNCVYATTRLIIAKLGVQRGSLGMLPLNRRNATCITQLGSLTAINADRIKNSTGINSVTYAGNY